MTFRLKNNHTLSHELTNIIDYPSPLHHVNWNLELPQVREPKRSDQCHREVRHILRLIGGGYYSYSSFQALPSLLLAKKETF